MHRQNSLSRTRTRILDVQCAPNMHNSDRVFRRMVGNNVNAFRTMWKIEKKRHFRMDFICAWNVKPFCHESTIHFLNEFHINEEKRNKYNEHCNNLHKLNEICCAMNFSFSMSYNGLAMHDAHTHIVHIDYTNQPTKKITKCPNVNWKRAKLLVNLYNAKYVITHSTF